MERTPEFLAKKTSKRIETISSCLNHSALNCIPRPKREKINQFYETLKMILNGEEPTVLAECGQLEISYENSLPEIFDLLENVLFQLEAIPYAKQLKNKTWSLPDLEKIIELTLKDYKEGIKFLFASLHHLMHNKNPLTIADLDIYYNDLCNFSKKRLELYIKLDAEFDRAYTKHSAIEKDFNQLNQIF